jgi:Holliday junction DNA helicase RuvA
MIAQLTGTLTYKSPHMLIVDVKGVGYAVSVSLTTFSTLPDEGNSITLMIHTHVREDQLVLYGFMTTDEKRLFAHLISVSGVGPKVALGILSGIPPEQLAGAITAGDLARLNAIPGVGRKTAERIVIDLKDKLARDPAIKATPAAAQQRTPAYEDALSALTNLGYKKAAAEKALSTIEWNASVQLETAIKDALKELVPQ